jgi:hypothetical protein
MAKKVEIPGEVHRFRAAADQYCAWVDAPPSDVETEAATAVRLLATLVHLAYEMPGADPEDLPEHDILLKGDDSIAIYKRFSSMPFQYYSQFWRPYDIGRTDGEPVTGDVADDLMDIYLDLNQGVLYMDNGHPVQAVFHWRFMFEVHWGRHATSALHVLHCYLTDPSRSDS